MAIETAAEIETLFKDSDGVAVVHGGITTYGHLDTADELEFETGQIIGTVLTVSVPTGRLTGLDVDDAITVGGTAYTIREHRRIEDGKLTQILLASL